MEHNLISGLIVTLYTRVWIEIVKLSKKFFKTTVTLYTRVWIEIC